MPDETISPLAPQLGDDSLSLTKRAGAALAQLATQGRNTTGLLQDTAVATGNGEALDVTPYASVAVQVTNATGGSFTIIWDGSADGGTTWVPVPFINVKDGINSLSANSAGIFTRQCTGLTSIRARISAIAGGAVITAAFSATDAAGSGPVYVTGDALAGAADGGNTVKVGGKYMETFPTYSTGQRTDLHTDSRGALRVTLNTFNGSGNTQCGSPSDTLAGNPGLFVINLAHGYIGGGLWMMLRTPNVFKPQSAVAMGSEVAIWTPASGKKFRLMGYHLTSSVAGNITLRSGTGGAIIAIVPVTANGEGVSVDLQNGILSAAANNVLTAQGPAASTLSGMVFGTEE